MGLFVNIKNHLDSDEKIIYFFRPSRKAYLLQYALSIILFLGALSLLIFSIIPKTTTISSIWFKILFVLSLIIILISLISVGKVEYNIFSRRYALTTQRLMYSRGLFTESFKSVMYNNITDVSLEQSFWDRLLNTGTLYIETAGAEKYELRYRKISKPFQVKKKISDLTPTVLSDDEM